MIHAYASLILYCGLSFISLIVMLMVAQGKDHIDTWDAIKCHVLLSIAGALYYAPLMLEGMLVYMCILTYLSGWRFVNIVSRASETVSLNLSRVIIAVTVIANGDLLIHNGVSILTCIVTVMFFVQLMHVYRHLFKRNKVRMQNLNGLYLWRSLVTKGAEHDHCTIMARRYSKAAKLA